MRGFLFTEILFTEIFKFPLLFSEFEGEKEVVQEFSKKEETEKELLLPYICSLLL